MGNLLEYSGIITKLRAMEARLLTDEQFEEISALTSITELVSYLNANSSYQDVPVSYTHLVYKRQVMKSISYFFSLDEPSGLYRYS